MTRSILIFLLVIFAFGPLSAQIELTRQVVGTIGGSNELNGQMNVSYTAGEAVIQTVAGENSVLTQGFLQPGAIMPLSFELDITATTCINANDGFAAVINLFGCTSPYTIEWSNGATGNIAYDLAPGLYSVTISTIVCSLTQEFEVLRGSDDACDLVFLNAFSPNDDGINDTWIIKNIDSEEFQENKVEIYNRWGQLIWSAGNYDNHDVVWDGVTNDRVKLISGTYFYLATVNDKLYKGYIEITR